MFILYLFSVNVLIIPLTTGNKYAVDLSSLLKGVDIVFQLLINPIFKWSIRRYGYLYFSSIFCASTVLPVCDAPVIKIIIIYHFYSTTKLPCSVIITLSESVTTMLSESVKYSILNLFCFSSSFRCSLRSVV